jgi:hypothetical protein
VSTKAWLRHFGTALLCMWWAMSALAHPVPESLVWIDTTPSGMQLTAQLPLNRLEFAFGKSLTEEPETVLARHGDALASYLLMHVGARGEGGGWQVLRPQMEIIGKGATAELQASFELRAPAAADPRRVELLYDVITHEVRTHRAQVFLRNDWKGGFAGQPPLLLGELNTGHNTLPLVLKSSARASVARLFEDGVIHIAEGTDHLLFLLLLLLVAPLAAARGRWHSLRPAKKMLKHTALVVTSFTVGHTATLVLGSSGLLVVPVRLVEVAVALTISIAALHAWRPLFARADISMALAFGLIHGMAFSASLSGAGLTPLQHGLALLSFNLGIETMQLIAVALVLPPLILLGCRQPALLGWLRRVLSIVCGLMGAAWAVQRLEWADLGQFDRLGDAGTLPLYIVGSLWALAAVTSARVAVSGTTESISKTG